MKDVTELIKALTGLAWPLMAGVVIWRLFPMVKEIARSRGFTIKVGEAEVTVQEYSEKLIQATADIQGRLASVSAAQAEPGGSRQPQARTLERALWVDDYPENNVTEVAQLRALGVEVRLATATDEGLRILSRAAPEFDVVISDMGRKESGRNNGDAGLDLIREIRARGEAIPIFIYAGPRTTSRRREILEAGGDGVTASPTELFELLRGVGEFPAQQS
ncbi:two-component system response regulator [Streptantibioticus rubrisoli]|uniref:Response regulator n=1 Tax=Streptantibioticus rubrisoli TaxID=1387313 RepID=A0ABT1PKJ0_9ACTN|nr:response regulator [Streptantibioticus rubrisoli]MCQ4045889.1 response regulator [Streptantibioticus rubrisoli]